MAASDPKSKKPCDASLNSRPEPPVFFVDRSLGRKIIPDALRGAGEQIRVHDELFPQDARDEDWLSEVGRRGWIVLTKDTRIRYRATEIAALLAARVRAFVLGARGDLQGTEIAAIFVKALPAMKRVLGETDSPFVAHVGRDAKVTVMKVRGA